MAKYQMKPPVFDALQFTGGVANAKTIVEGVTALTQRFIARYQPAYSEYGSVGGAVQEFKTPERIKIESVDGTITWYANPTDWVSVSRDGNVEILTNAAFTAQYQAV